LYLPAADSEQLSNFKALQDSQGGLADDTLSPFFLLPVIAQKQ